MLPSTFRSYEKVYLGTTTPMTHEYQDIVMKAHVKKQLKDGRTVADIFRQHNQGNYGNCIKGVNKYGVRYDSCSYVKNALKIYSSMGLY